MAFFCWQESFFNWVASYKKGLSIFFSKLFIFLFSKCTLKYFKISLWTHFFTAKYDIISQLHHGYTKGPFCMTRLIRYQSASCDIKVCVPLSESEAHSYDVWLSWNSAVRSVTSIRYQSESFDIRVGVAYIKKFN